MRGGASDRRTLALMNNLSNGALSRIEVRDALRRHAGRPCPLILSGGRPDEQLLLTAGEIRGHIDKALFDLPVQLAGIVEAWLVGHGVRHERHGLRLRLFGPNESLQTRTG